MALDSNVALAHLPAEASVDQLKYVTRNKS